ncbi:MAG: molybdopterin-dependent oxidoreductase [Coleofasciculaceae cyanobacterium]
MKKTSISLPVALVLANIVAGLTGCSNQPNEANLEQLRQEAIAQNAAIVAQQAKTQTPNNWQFVVQGQTATRKPLILNLSKLEALATTSVWTREPHNTSNSNPNTIFHFRGIAISKLLQQVGVAPNVRDVTFISHDAYRATISLADLKKYPIIIALKRNNQKISRSDGGPLYLVFPYTQHPQLQQKYPDRFWAFYLTDMVIGTEPIKLKVGKRTLNASDLKKLKPITLNETVGYRIGWPVGKVKLSGIRVSDALKAAGISIPKGSAVIVRGKSPIYRQTEKPIRIEASDIDRCNIILATHWGDNRQPIPAKMGGPVTLALSSACKTQSDDRRWVTFVEALSIKK